jgi:DNA-binding LacI/PurR family transcriptional regulator
MDDYNIEVIDDYIAYAPYTRDGRRETINKLLDLKVRPTAIFITN